MSLRKLTHADQDALEIFLKKHVDTSMFLRSNLYHAGLIYQNKPFHGDYFASFNDSDVINGVLAHYWNGNIMMQSPDLIILKKLVDGFKSHISREIAGVLGEDCQAEIVIEQLGLKTASYAVNYPDDLYALELSELIVPTTMNNPNYQIIAAKDCDPELLVEWLCAYHVEALGAEANSEILVKEIREEVACTPDRFVLTMQGKPVSLCGFNAKLPDMVQIGPVWTPVECRNRGFARGLLALCLSDVQKKGVNRALLFTNNQAAIRSYKALGFNKVGAYRLAILKTPIMLNRVS